MTLFLSRRAQNSQLPVVGWSPASEQTPCLPEAELMRLWLCSLAPPGLHSPDVLPSLGLSPLSPAQAKPNHCFLLLEAVLPTDPAAHTDPFLSKLS